MNKKISIEKIFLIPFIAFVVFFEIYPLINVVFRSIYTVDDGFTFNYYQNILSNSLYTNAIRNSLIFATTCSLIGAVGGTYVGYVAHKLPKKIYNFIVSIYSLPLTLSGLVVAFAFIILLGRNGVLNLIVQRIFSLPKDIYFNVYSWYGICVVYAFFQIPLMTLTMSAAFQNLDKTLVEAARNLGARHSQVWRHVIIPVLAPGFLAGLSIQIATMLGAFGTFIALVGGQKNLLSVQIYYNTSESTFNLPQADALSVVLIGIITILLFGLRSLENKFRHASE